MKLLHVAAFFAVLLMAGSAIAQDDKPKKEKAKNKYKTEKERMSYALGYDIGLTFQKREVELDTDLLMKAFKAGYSKADPDMTREEFEASFLAYQKAAQAAAEAIAKNRAEKNKKEGEAFLAKNKKRKGVVTMKSGLQYEVLKKTKGETPKKDSVVKAHYHGTFIDGEVFDSSLGKRPLIIPVNGLIKGMSEALQNMKVGEKWKVFVPTDLAYGSEPDPRSPIPANAALIFELELLAIEEAPKPEGDQPGNDSPADGESAPESTGEEDK